MNIDQTQIQFVPLQNQLMVGKRGPVGARIVMDFASAPEYDLDMQNVQSRALFDLCQTIYVDNSQGGAALRIEIAGSGQVVIVPNLLQGYFNVLCPNPIRMKFTCSGGQVITVILCDVAIPGATWSTV